MTENHSFTEAEDAKIIAVNAAEAIRHARHHKATMLAAQTTRAESLKTQSVRQFVKLQMANIEFQLMALQSELDFLTALSEMKEEDKIPLLFDLLDRNGDGTLDARELASGLRKIDEGAIFGETLDRCINAVAKFDKDEDAMLDVDEFRAFMGTLSMSLGITLQEVAELLVLQLLFSEEEDDASVEEELAAVTANDDVNEAVKEIQKFNKILDDDRMRAIFLMADADHNGYVDFREVSIGLHKITGDMERSSAASVAALIMFDKDDTRTLNYKSFAKLITNVVAASDGELTFDDVADTMMKASCQPTNVSEEELADLMVADEMYRELRQLEESVESTDQEIDVLQYGRMQRLFDLMDLDHNGHLSLEELTIAMSKFQEAKGIEEAVQMSTDVMKTFDQDNDLTLNRTEFALYLSRLSLNLETDIHELVDFLVVTMALKDNDEGERAYIESVVSYAEANLIAEQCAEAVTLSTRSLGSSSRSLRAGSSNRSLRAGSSNRSLRE